MLWFLVVLLLVTAYWPRCSEVDEPRARTVSFSILTGLLLAWLSQNLWVGTFMAVFVLSTWNTPYPSLRLHLTVQPALIWAFLYVLLAQEATFRWVESVLLTIALIGVLAAFWMLFGLWAVRDGLRRSDDGSRWVMGEHRYDKVVTWNGRTLLRLYEKHPYGWTGGQGNPNYTQVIAGLSQASSIGLVLLGHWWALSLFALALVPMLIIQYQWPPPHQPCQGILYLLVIAVALLPVTFGLSGWLVAALIGLPATVFAMRRVEWWSNRFLLWGWSLVTWRRLSWKGKLIGAGPESWVNIYHRVCPFTFSATHSHNEFLQALVEQGLIGFVALVGYCATSLWRLSQAGPMGHAVLLPAAVMVAAMCVMFPVSLYHETIEQDDKGVPFGRGYGAPILNTLALALAVLVEGVTK